MKRAAAVELILVAAGILINLLVIGTVVTTGLLAAVQFLTLLEHAALAIAADDLVALADMVSVVVFNGAPANKFIGFCIALDQGQE
jgi:hypothetical protein